LKSPEKSKIKKLEQALENERLKVHAYEKLLEVIKREDEIDFLKKGAAKQFKNLLGRTGGR
jgi:transposase